MPDDLFVAARPALAVFVGTIYSGEFRIAWFDVSNGQRRSFLFPGRFRAEQVAEHRFHRHRFASAVQLKLITAFQTSIARAAAAAAVRLEVALKVVAGRVAIAYEMTILQVAAAVGRPDRQAQTVLLAQAALERRIVRWLLACRPGRLAYLRKSRVR